MLNGPDETLPAVTLVQAKQQLRADADMTVDDDLIAQYVLAATLAAEHELGRSLLTQTWTLRLPGFPGGPIELARPPVQAVTGITYTDGAGVSHTLDPSAYSLCADPLRPTVAAVDTWPVGTNVEVTFRAGYGDTPDAVPASVRAWILLQVGALYANREVVVVTNGAAVSLPFADGLLDRYRVWKV